MQHSYSIGIKIFFLAKQLMTHDDVVLPLVHGKTTITPNHEPLNRKQTIKGTMWKRFFLSIFLMTLTRCGEPQTQLIIYQDNKIDVQISQSISKTNTHKIKL